MAKEHKFAWNGVDLETVLSIEQVANMAQRAAAESTGDLMHGKQRIVSTRSSDREIEFQINDFLITFKKYMVFDLSFTPSGDRTYATTTIEWYMTSQETIAGFIPVWTKTMVAHHTYMQFVRNLAEQVRSADSTARVTIREGADGERPSSPPVAAGTGEPAALQHPPEAPARELPPVPPAAPVDQANQASGVVPTPVLPPVPPPPPPPPLPTPVHTGLDPSAPMTIPPAPASGPPRLVTGIPGSPNATPSAPQQHGSTPLVPARSIPRVPPPPSAAVEAEDLDATRMATAQEPSKRWVVTVSDGQVLDVDDGLVLGRNPSANEPLRPVPVADELKAISKTHVQLVARDGLVWVTDLHSTNGTTASTTAGAAAPCPPGTPVPVGEGSVIRLGGVTLTLGER